MRLILSIIICLGIHLILGCSSIPESTSLEKNDKKPVFSDEQKQLAQDFQDEITIGRAMASKLLGAFGSYESNPKMLNYINMIGLTLAKQSGRPELVFRFGILDTDESNAFAAPGGYIFVTKGLLKFIQSESEIAGVLAHEIGHINRKHMYKEIKPKRKVSTGENLSRLLSRGAADIGASVSQAVNAGLKMLVEDGLSHESEYDADSVAIFYAHASGYNPYSLIQVLERMETMNKQNHFNKTHPPFAERIQRLKSLLSENGIKNSMIANEDVIKKRFNSYFDKRGL